MLDIAQPKRYVKYTLHSSLPDECSVYDFIDRPRLEHAWELVMTDKDANGSGRLSLILLGGDWSEPRVRQFVYRFAIASIVAMGCLTFLSIGYEGRYKPALQFLVKPIWFVIFSVLIWRFYQQSDEYVRKITVLSMAAGGYVMLAMMIVAIEAVRYLELPELSLLTVLMTLFISYFAVIMVTAWIVTAKKPL